MTWRGWIWGGCACGALAACGNGEEPAPEPGGVGSAGGQAGELGAGRGALAGSGGEGGGGSGEHAGGAAGGRGGAATGGRSGSGSGARGGSESHAGEGASGGESASGGEGASDGGSSRGGAGGTSSGATSSGGAGGTSAGTAGTIGEGGGDSGGVGGSIGLAGTAGTGAGTGGSGGLEEPPCDPSSCVNGGTCQAGVSGCVCPAGFFGPDCGLSVCDPNPCEHGSCARDWSGPVVCTCDVGWEGLRCGVEIDECRTNNGGCDARTACTNVPGGRVCGSCPPGFVGTGESGCQPAPCSTPADCTSAFGAVAGCAAWQCVGGYCEHAAACVDGDGDGVNAWSSCGCGAVDCDDADDDIGERQRCYTGPAGTEGVGSCRAGTRRCVGADGAGRCSGEVTPSAESCNGVDDDCNGATDDGLPVISCGAGACRVTVPACTSGSPTVCNPGTPLTLVDGCNDVDDDCDGAVDEDCPDCVHVAPDGDDESAALSGATVSFRTIQPALDFAAENAVGRVCVAAGPACGATAHYYGPPGQNLTMRDGVDLVGNYESTAFTHCDNSTTVLWPRTDLGVYFPPGIEGPVRLDGFTIERGVFGSGVSAAVTLIGARGVVLSNLTATSSPDSFFVAVSGVNLFDGSVASVVKSAIRAEGGGVAVRSVGSRVSIEANWSGSPVIVPVFAAARCSLWGIEAHGVFLEDSPGSRVEGSGICGNAEPEMMAMLVTGDAAGTLVARSSLYASQGSDSGQGVVRVEQCDGMVPRFYANSLIGSGYGDDIKAFEVLGDCRPVVEGTTVIHTNGSRDDVAISCRGSGCVLSGNEVVAGSSGYPLSGYHRGIFCDGGCARVDGNRVRITAAASSGSGRSRAVELYQTGAFVDRNAVNTGCFGNDEGVVVWSSWSRFQNNDIIGRSGCLSNPGGRSGAGGPTLAVHTGFDGAADVHSNRVRGGYYFPAPSCMTTSPEDQTATVTLSASAGASFATFRNNELIQGECDGAVVRFGSSGTLFHFENNELTGSARVGTTLVDDRRSNQRLADIALVNALPGASGNRSDGVLVDTGSPVGAPAYDFAGSPRDSSPDIGAFEAP